MKRFFFAAVFLLFAMLALPSRGAAQTYQTTCPAGSSVTSWGSARNSSTGAILQNFCIDSSGNAILNFPYAQANCFTNNAVAYANGTTGQLTCNSNFKYSPTGTWWIISTNGNDNATIEGNLGSAGQPLVQLVTATSGGLGAAFQLDAANQLAEFGPGGTNFSFGVYAQSIGAGFPLAASGINRFSKAGTIAWRNNANTGDNVFSVNSLDQLQYNGSPVTFSGVSFSTNAVTTTTPQITGLTTNNTILGSFYLAAPVGTLSNFYYDATQSDFTANVYDLGVYGPGCLNSATNVPLVFHTGPTAGTTLFPSTGALHAALAGAPVTVNMPAGWYCFAYTSSGATPAARIGGDTVQIHVIQFANGAAPLSGTGATTGGTLNSTITAPALSIVNSGTIWLVGY